ncbi:CYTH domain-containing protein [Chitinimonas sp. BJB300]|uniref:CYTH domain-containing protein n=1 Tax=Chitinimonas sp. BJB300 TaxID=1559339 RepID=UPI000C1018BF|nr:CYTH domain-containing protein [Chitinimonas sp. BJB300]PHV12802.1 adenylate cyclase [Chitinimonas sp. BJB300]TSJ91329.1 CYTH domain-containing protein [Chitinimonas sp. BJB300]
MAKEIERRFKLKNDSWRGLVEGEWLKQGYLSVERERTVRVRVKGSEAWLTLKSNISNVSRHEFEYPIPLADAETILAAMCPMLVEKKRYRIQHGSHLWEVDEFFGQNAGLMLAEVELGDEAEAYARPDWLGDEVTEDPRYTNAHLSKHAWPTWPENQLA